MFLMKHVKGLDFAGRVLPARQNKLCPDHRVELPAERIIGAVLLIGDEGDGNDVVTGTVTGPADEDPMQFSSVAECLEMQSWLVTVAEGRLETRVLTTTQVSKKTYRSAFHHVLLCRCGGMHGSTQHGNTPMQSRLS